MTGKNFKISKNCRTDLPKVSFESGKLVEAVERIKNGVYLQIKKSKICRGHPSDGGKKF